MNIAAMSVIMSQTQVKQQASVAVMDKALKQSEVQSEAMIKMMEESMTPHLGSNVDIKT